MSLRERLNYPKRVVDMIENEKKTEKIVLTAWTDVYKLPCERRPE